MERGQTTTEDNEAVLSSELHVNMAMIWTGVDRISLHAGSLRYHVERYMVNGSEISRQQIVQEVAQVI